MGAADLWDELAMGDESGMKRAIAAMRRAVTWLVASADRPFPATSVLATSALSVPTMAAVSLTLLSLSACVVEPAKPYVALPSPDTVRPRLDTVTQQPTFNLIPRDDQRFHGDMTADEAIAQYQRRGMAVLESGDDPRWQRLQRIFTKVHQRSHLHAEPLRAVLVETNQFQAYTTGGSVIIFYTGLTERLSDDALAMVIGHEIAHVAAGHIAEQSSRDLVNLNAIRDHIQVTYSVPNEHEADVVGMVYATLAGYDPDAAAAIWAALTTTKDQRLAAFTATHPSHDDRTKILQQTADKVRPLRGIADWKPALLCNAVYCAADD